MDGEVKKRVEGGGRARPAAPCLGDVWWWRTAADGRRPARTRRRRSVVARGPLAGPRSTRGSFAKCPLDVPVVRSIPSSLASRTCSSILSLSTGAVSVREMAPATPGG